MSSRSLRALAGRIADRARARLARAQGDEGGFILLESVIAITLITVIMSAVGAEYVNGIAATNHARLQSVAVQIAGSNMDQVRALHASDLLTGRGATAVDSERQAVANFTTVQSSSYEAYDSTAALTSTGTTFSTSPSTTTVGTSTYSIYRYFECTLPSNQGSCLTTPSQATLTSNNIRAIVVVTWPQRGCATVSSVQTCSYATSSIISADDDLTFDLNQPLPPAPTVSNPTALTVAVNDAVSYQMAVTNNTGVSPFTWATTSGSLPTGLTMSTTGLITGSITGSASTYTSTITVTDAYLRTASDTITWTVEAPLTIAQLPNQTSFKGATVTKTLSASGGSGSGYTFSDPNSTLPTGLTITSSGTIAGVVAGTAPKTYAVTIQATDSQSCPACASTPRTTTMSFTWTVGYPPLTVSSPGPQEWTVAAPLSSVYLTTLQMTASGGDNVYVWSATGLPAGLVINPVTGLITGTPLTTGTGTATISVTDPTATSVTGNSVTFTWTVFAAPTMSTPANQTNSVGGTVSLTPTNTCPNTTCTYTAANLPTGLSISSTTGTISGTVGGSAKTYAGVTVTVTDAAGSSATSLPFTWTVFAAPTVSGLGNQAFTETGVESVPVTYSCPTSSCTLSLTNSVPGLGLTTSSTTTADLTTSTSLAVTNASGTVYVGGTVQNSAVSGTATSAAYKPAVTISTSDNATATSGTSTWTAYVVPTVTSPGTLNSPSNTPVNVTVPSTCADSPCTFTLTGAPAGLSINSSGVITGTITSAAGSFPSVKVTVTDYDQVSASTTFAWTVVAAPKTFTQLVNNIGVSSDSRPSAANFDANGYSYSQNGLTTANSKFVAGGTVTSNGLSFTWPSTAGTGSADNIQVLGQTLAVSGTGSTLGFLVGAANSAASGTATVYYTDGSTSTFTLSSPDWANAGTIANPVVVTETYRNNASGRTTPAVSVFYASVALNPAKTVSAVTLPTTASLGSTSPSLHVFAASLTSAGLAPSFNNVGVTTPGSTVNGGMDSSGNTFSKTALTTAGATSGGTVISNGTTFTWPSTAGTTSADNVLANGQTIAPTTALSGTTLGFLLASNGATTSGTVTITYTDGTTSSGTIAAPAWDSGNTTGAALATSSYDSLNSGTNSSTVGSRYVYYAGVALTSGKTIATIQLPTVSSSVSGNAMHIFAMAVK